MSTKINTELSEELKMRLKEMFVEDYDKVNDAKNNINIYLKSINIDDEYNYNDFCNGFLEISDTLIQTLSTQKTQTIDSIFIIGEIMSIMVKQKIHESNSDENKKLYKIFQHELRTKTIRREKL